MKKILFTLFVVLFVAAGCSSSSNNSTTSQSSSSDNLDTWANATINFSNAAWVYQYPSDWVHNDSRPSNKPSVSDSVGQSETTSASDTVDGAISSVSVAFTGGQGTLNILCFASHPMYKFIVIDPKNPIDFLQVNLFDQSVILNPGVACRDQNYFKKINAPNPAEEPVYKNYNNFINVINQTLRKQ